MNTTAPLDHEELARWQRWSLAIGILALIVCIVGGLFSPVQFFRAWLAAYVFYVGLPLGSMAILMIHHLTGGAWGLLLRRILEAAMATLPLLAVLFLPIALGLGCLYLWAQPEIVAEDEILQRQQFYLNPSLFLVRAAVYFILWMAIAFLMLRWSRREDRTGAPRLAVKAIYLSAFGAVIYGITIHFASTDWVLSLQSEFPSTIFGPLFASAQLLSAMAFAVIVLAWAARRPPLAEVASPKALRDVGNLLFALLIIGAYMEWFQFMLVWIANLPADVAWYIPRGFGGWQVVVWALFLLHFAVPFVVLLFRDVKENLTALACVAGLVLLMDLVFRYWQVLPPFHAEGWGPHWLDFLMPIALGGPWLAWFLWQLETSPLVPPHDYNRAMALELRHSDEDDAAPEEALAHG